MIEILVLFALITIAVIANHFQKRKRALRQAQRDYEYQQQLKEWEERRKAARLKKLLAKKQQQFGAHIPQDSALRRHYVSHLRAIIESLQGSQPTDNTLRRHHDSLINNELEQCLADESCVQRLFQRFQAHQQTLADRQIQKASRLVTRYLDDETLIKQQAPQPKPHIEKQEKTVGAHVPQDSALRRHYVSHLRAVIESLQGPQPTDNTLRRHHDSLINNELEQCLADESCVQRLFQHFQAHQQAIPREQPKKIPEPVVQHRDDEIAEESQPSVEKHIPEDVVLRRHFLTHLRSIIESLHTSKPSDNTLRRHHETLLANELDSCLDDEAYLQKILNKYEAFKKTSTEKILKKAQNFIEIGVKDIQAIKLSIPEDATLRRHFICHQRALIESSKQPKPTDSTLLRHYQAMIDAELEERLQAMSV